MTDVGALAALAAGALALLSPCSALLLPSFFAYAFTSRVQLVARTGAFYVGLLLTLVPLGVGAGAASALFYGHRSLLISVAGWMVIALGVWQLLGRGFGVPGVGRWQSAVSLRDSDRWTTTVLLGSVYGLAGFCSGPVLGSILTVAATSGTPLAGGFLLALYALGMALPLFVLAALWDRFDLGRRRWLRPRPVRLGRVQVHPVQLVGGLMFIVIGVVFLTYEGTAGLVGATGLPDLTDLEVRGQAAVVALSAATPSWLLPAVVLVVAAGVAVRRASARKPSKTGS